MPGLQLPQNHNSLSLFSVLHILSEFLSLANSIPEPHDEGKCSSQLLFSGTEENLEGDDGDAELTTGKLMAFFTY